MLSSTGSFLRVTVCREQARLASRSTSRASAASLRNRGRSSRTGSRQSRRPVGRIHSKEFVALSDGEKTEVLKQVESRHAEFFLALVRETYSGYYSNSEVLQVKGLPLKPSTA